MQDKNQVEDVFQGVVEQVENGKNPDELSLEQLVLLINTERLKHLQKQTEEELLELKDRQKQVAELHELIKEINNATTKKGELDLKDNPELQELLEKAKELGVDYDETKTKYSRDEKERLLENIRLTVEDLNIQNDMQLQTVSRLTNERYESYQMARSILRPLHEAKVSNARHIAGR